MSNHAINVIGASLGGVEALQELTAGLPKDLPAAVFVVLHVSAQAPSLLRQILNRCGALKAVHPKDGEAIQAGRIYVAPPDNHLIVENGYMRVLRGPKENRHRPAIDVLFRSAARAYGNQVVGVVLTGSLDDGTVGMLAVKKRGGICVVQDPESAFCPDMPKSVLRYLKPDYTLPLPEIAPALELIAQTKATAPESPVSKEMEQESRVAEMDMNRMSDDDKPGKPSAFACPDCHGVLWEIDDDGQDFVRYRCRVGHAYTAASFAAAHSEHLENSMWAALRALEESASLARRMADKAKEKDRLASAARFEEHAMIKERQASLMRTVLLENEQLISDMYSATSKLNVA
ncbi:MAG: CheB methylesterase [Acidobacteriales bacterium]|nr:CheB methylesterase [Terriglobales bacterium]